MSLFLLCCCLIVTLPLSNGCMKTIPPEETEIPTTLPEEPLSTTANLCEQCVYTDITPIPTEPDSRLPSITSETSENGCLSRYMRCFESESTICQAVNLFAVTATDTVLLSTGLTNTFATITCDRTGEYVTEDGEAIERIYCVFFKCF